MEQTMKNRDEAKKFRNNAEKTASGFVQQVIDLDERIMARTKDLGNYLERIGERVQIVGETIFKIGRMIEQMNEQALRHRSQSSTKASSEIKVKRVDDAELHASEQNDSELQESEFRHSEDEEDDSAGTEFH